MHLPSGLVLRLSDAAARRARVATRSSETLVGGTMEALAILEAKGVASAEDGSPIDVSGLSLRDLHVLRALLLHAGVTSEPDAELPCDNCGEPFRVAPSSLLEIGPYVDGELDDPELDKPFDHQRNHPIPPIRVGGGVARTIRIAARTAREATPLFRAEGARSFRITPAIVVAMGIVALGKERRASVIADALMEASPAAYQKVADLLYDAHYGARLVAVFRCPSCGARNDLDVPWIREIPYEVGEGRGARRPFPDLDTFEAMVAEAAGRVFAERGVRNIDLVVHDGVPFCDDGGEPLLGCYTPGGVDEELGIPRAPEIRVFYETFAKEHRDDPSFDVAKEIDETIDHEVTHHLHHLAGDDPLDDEERLAIASDAEKRIGKREIARRMQKGLVADLAGFFRTMWPLVAVALVATILSFCG